MKASRARAPEDGEPNIEVLLIHVPSKLILRQLQMASQDSSRFKAESLLEVALEDLYMHGSKASPAQCHGCEPPPSGLGVGSEYRDETTMHSLKECLCLGNPYVELLRNGAVGTGR